MLDASANRPAGERYDWWPDVVKRVRSLQRLMLRSRANVLASMRRVTQENAGRHTAALDGVVVLDDESRAVIVEWLSRNAMAATPSPVRRVYIPKSNGKRRPLGIPTLLDRAVEAMVRSALELEWEACFEPEVYGFRPGRGCHDATPRSDSPSPRFATSWERSGIT